MKLGFRPSRRSPLQLSIETRHRSTLALLFAREAWQLAVGSPPRPEVRPNTGTSRPLDAARIDAVSAAWQTAWTHVHVDTRGFSETVSVFGPDGAALDREAFDRWRDSLIPAMPLVRYRHQPESLAQETIAEAHGRGLRTLLVLPLGRHFWERRSNGVLMLSDVTRGDIGAFERALSDYD